MKKNKTLSLMELLKEASRLPIRGSSPLRGQEKKDIIKALNDAIVDGIDDPITIGGDTYNISGTSLEKESILLWLWSDSAQQEKTLKINLRVDDVDIDSNAYWGEDEI